MYLLGPFVREACTDGGGAPARLILEAGVGSFDSSELPKIFPAGTCTAKTDINH